MIHYSSAMDSVSTKKDNISNEQDELVLFLQLLDSPQDFLQSILLSPSPTNNKQHQIQVDALKSISKSLFSRVEKFAALYEKIDKEEIKRANGGSGDIHEDEDEEEQCPLSGLTELYTGSIISNSSNTDSAGKEEKSDEDYFDDIDDDAIEVDAETIFNQVDVQNSALLSQMKKVIKKLKKNVTNDGSNVDRSIRLLNMDEMNSEDNYNDDDDDVDDDVDMQNDSDDEGLKEESENENESDDDIQAEDEETRRIRERMERSMAAMSGSDSNDDESNGHKEDEEGIMEEDEKDKEVEEEDAIDQDREDLYDGFFDLHEMEQMADEEEEMLPDEAYGEPEEDNEEMHELRKSMLPHIKARKGAEDDDDNDEDEEFNFLDKKVENTSRRRRYRDDGDIEALTGMYGDTNDDAGDEEDEEGDVINMTAADFFGPPKKPSKEFMQKSKQGTKKVTFDDDDSWDNHDFGEDGKDWRDGDVERDEENDDASTPQSDDDEDDEDDEQIEPEEDDNDDQTSNKLSNYAHRSNKLDQMTKHLEKDMLAEKPWQMVGEAKGTQRPTNSLLEVTPTFEFATKMAPIITAEHTESIEEMIKRRILAEDWDDVIPRELPDIGISKRRGELPEVSQERSKLSLGELYEREYLKKVAGYDADAAEKETEEEKVKNEMKMLFANLCSKLDALSNYHFAPRPVADEPEIKTNATPAVAMEEVLPLHVSDAQAMAPEEVYDKKKGRDGILRGESEMDQVRFVFVDYNIVCLFLFPDILMIPSTTTKHRMIVSDYANLKRLLAAKLGKPSWPMRNSSLDSNLNSVSTIHMRNEKCVRNSKWLEQVVNWYLEKSIKMQISKLVRSSFKRCKVMFRCLSRRMIRLVRREKETTAQSQAHLNCNKAIFLRSILWTLL